MIRAVLFDLGGVILTSPFEAFARYEGERGLRPGFLRSLNTRDPDANAWARLERGEVSFEEFCDIFEADARAAGGEIDARELMARLSGKIRPEMLAAVKACAAKLKTGLLTNNWSHSGSPSLTPVAGFFDVVIESCKVGIRKPDPRFYERALSALEIEATQAVFLDDLGINLKPARAMGITTIKVSDPAQAIADLEAVVGFSLAG